MASRRKSSAVNDAETTRQPTVPPARRRGSVNRPYWLLGLSLSVGGALFTPIAYFLIGSAALTAVGITAIMIGLTCVALANTRPGVGPEASELMLKAGMQNAAALLEELELKTRAIYLPSTAGNGHPRALVPLGELDDVSRIRTKVPERLIVRYGASPEEMAISLATPGGMNVELLATKPEATAQGIEDAARFVLQGVLDIADSVSVRLRDGVVDVEVGGSRLHYEDVWYYRSLGSPLASILAAISSEALDKPVRITEESSKKGKSRIVLEVMS